MIFIDWWSPSSHLIFLKCFFESLGLKDQEIIFFNKNLKLNDQNTVYINANSRFAKFVKILEICRKNKNKKIIFLSYDSFFMPIINLIIDDYYLFEHNTVPERKNKHYFFQKVFFKSMKRVCLTPDQKNKLEKISPFAKFIGHPLHFFNKDLYFKGNDLFIPSLRYDVSVVEQLCKRNLNFDFHIKDSKKISTKLRIQKNLIIHDDIDLEKLSDKVGAMVFAVPYTVRFSGWYNEAIFNNLPIIFLEKNQQINFQKQFNGFPSIHSDNQISLKKLNSLKKLTSGFSKEIFIKKNNTLFRQRFFEYINHLKQP